MVKNKGAPKATEGTVSSKRKAEILNILRLLDTCSALLKEVNSPILCRTGIRDIGPRFSEEQELILINQRMDAPLADVIDAKRRIIELHPDVKAMYKPSSGVTLRIGDKSSSN